MTDNRDCPTCGSGNPDTARFCRSCGAFLVSDKGSETTIVRPELPLVPPSPPPATVGIGRHDTTTISRRPPVTPTPDHGPTPSRSPRGSYGSRAPLYIAIAACVVALAAVGATLVVAMSSRGTSPPSRPASRPVVTDDHVAGDRAAYDTPGSSTTEHPTPSTTLTATTSPPPTIAPPPPVPIDSVGAIEAVYDSFVAHDWDYARSNFTNGAGTGPGQPDSYWESEYGGLREYRLVPSRVRPEDGATVVGLLTHEVDDAGAPFSWQFCLAFRTNGTEVRQIGRATVRGRVDGEWVDFDRAQEVVGAC